MLAGEIWAEKWESWSFVHTTVFPQLIWSQMQSSDWPSSYVHNFFDQWKILDWKQIRRVCTQPENHSSNQGQFWKVGCLSFFQYRTMSQSKVTLLRKPKVDILVKVAWEKRSLLWREATMKMPQDWAPADKLMHSMHDLTVIRPILPEQLLAVCPNFVKSTFKTNNL